MRRALTWVLLLPFAAASVLIGHGVAYRVTGAPADGLHGYLAHAPQIVLILSTLALLGLAADARARRSSPLSLALLAIGAFVAQEHLERLVHTGEVPFLLTSPALWIGIALQLPLTIAVWWFARRVACDLAASPRRAAPRLGALAVSGLRARGRPSGFSPRTTAASGRGPPVLS